MLPVAQPPDIDPTTWFDRFTRLDDGLDALLNVLEQLRTGLRPLSGHLNVHSLPSDRIAMQRYNMVTGQVLTIQTGMPKGVAARVRIRCTDADVYLTTQLGNPSTENAWIITQGSPQTFDTRSDLALISDPAGIGGPVWIAIETFDASA